MLDVSIFMAFAAGLISFLSPCVLPLVPGYISFISGVSVEEVKARSDEGGLGRRERRMVLLNAIFFIGGFSIVFILLGASATWIGTFFSSKMSILTKVAGLVIIFFGLFKMGLFRVIIFFGLFKMGLFRVFLFYREAKFQFKDRKFGLAGAALIGAAFAFGWTPCIGPILGSILAYAGTLDKTNQGMILLFVYSLGLGIPFLLTAIGINQFFKFFDKIKKYLGTLEFITGLILVILGLMIFFNKLILIPGYFSFLNKFSL
jgi:cytochrome c-type biogenesis protein